MNTQATVETMPSLETISEDDEIVADYPFKSWTDMRDALHEGLNTEFVGETYPLWEAAEMPVYSEVKRLLKCGAGTDKQQIVDDIVGLLCGEGNRYAHEFMNDCIDAIDLLLKVGAIFPSYLLFDRWCDGHIESELSAYTARGELLDYYGPKGRIVVPADVKGLEPRDWEEIDDDEWKMIEKSKKEMNKVRMRYLVYCSEWLQELQKNAQDDDNNK